MQDELKELIETAMYREVASQAFYEAAREKTENPGAKKLLEELGREEHVHYRMLQDFSSRKRVRNDWRKESVADLKISEYLTDSDTLEGAGLQETLVFAMKREQQAVEFYSRMMGILRTPEAKEFCERMVHEELKHKRRLELLYDEIYYSEH